MKKGRLESGVVACQACHRSEGEGDAASGFGNLTGLTKEYLAKQLNDFQSGARENRVMQVVARNLTAADIEVLSLYYSGLKPEAVPCNNGEPPVIGVTLAEKGNTRRGIQSCISCHSTQAKTLDSTPPVLSGQHPLYIKNQLLSWRAGLRKNDRSDVMANIAKKLSQAEIDAVAIYFGRLPRTPH